MVSLYFPAVRRVSSYKRTGRKHAAQGVLAVQRPGPDGCGLHLHQEDATAVGLRTIAGGGGATLLLSAFARCRKDYRSAGQCALVPTAARRGSHSELQSGLRLSDSPPLPAPGLPLPPSPSYR